jgi:hypothetical protein
LKLSGKRALTYGFSQRALGFLHSFGTGILPLALASPFPEANSFYRDHVIEWAKDLGRAIDYVETRSDLDHEKLAYYGFSWGGTLAPIMRPMRK